MLSVALIAALAACVISSEAAENDGKPIENKISYEELQKEAERREGQELIVLNFRKRFLVASNFETLLEKFFALLNAQGIKHKEWFRTTGYLEIGVFIEGGFQEMKKFEKAALNQPTVLFVKTRAREMFPDHATDREQMEFLESQWYRGEKKSKATEEQPEAEPEEEEEENEEEEEDTFSSRSKGEAKKQDL